MDSSVSPSEQAVHTHVNYGSRTQIAHFGSGAQNIHIGSGTQNINHGSGDFYNNSPCNLSVNISISLFNIKSCRCASTRGAAYERRNRNHRSLLLPIISRVQMRRHHQSVDRNITPVRSTSSHGCSPSINAPSQVGPDTYRRKPIITFLGTRFLKSYKRDPQDRTALHDASRSGPLLVRHSLNNDHLPLLPGLHAKINLTNLIDEANKQSWTPVHYAAINDDLYSLYLLVEKGADLESHDNDGRRVLHLASELGRLSIVDYLLDKGVEPGERDERGLTALHLASMKGHDVVVRSILRKAAQVGKHHLRREKEDFYSWTPLHYAVQTQQLQAVEALVDKLDDKSDLDIRDCQGRTALHHACAIQTCIQSRGQGLPVPHEAYHVASAIVRVLVDAGAQLDLQDCMGFTALMLAAQGANVEAVGCLVDNGADVHVVDGRGNDNPGRHNRTARDYAEHDAPPGEDRDKVLRILSSRQPEPHFLRRL